MADPHPLPLPPADPFSFTPPRSDDALRDWMAMIAAAIAPHPARYRLDQHIADHLAAHARAFADSLRAAHDPVTRCPLTTQQKNAIREKARPAFLAVMNAIKADPSIDATDKLALGMRRIDPRPKRPIEPPDSHPILTPESWGDGTHTLRYRDEHSPDRSCRPKNAHFLDLRIIIVPFGHAIEASRHQGIEGALHAEAPLPEGAIIRTERITRTPFTIEHPRELAGWTATYFGRWSTTTRKAGPWSRPACMTIAVAFRPGE